jgi:hypothetical protein
VNFAYEVIAGAGRNHKPFKEIRLDQRVRQMVGIKFKNPYTRCDISAGLINTEGNPRRAVTDIYIFTIA